MLPQEIQSVLSKFRQAIRRYVFLEGIALLIAIACAIFWITFAVDVIYFRISRLELPSSFRLLVLMGMVIVLATVAASWFFFRLLRSFRNRDLALALERRFPQLQDRLITTVEFEGEDASQLKSAMMERTSREAVDALTKIDIDESFDPTPLKKLGMVAAVLFCTLAVFSVANAAGVKRWMQAYLYGEENYWDPFRKNSLNLRVLAQPGDRVKEFDSNRIYKHPRGSDLELIVESAEEMTVPERVDLNYLIFASGGTKRGRATMSPVGSGRFVQTISQVVDDHELWMIGGDFVNRRPYRVQVVDPPEIDSISLQCDYPSYTGMDGQEDQIVRVVATQVALPMETEFVLNAQANKPIREVDLRSDRFRLRFGRRSEAADSAEEVSLELLDENGVTQKRIALAAPVESLYSSDRSAFQFPLVVTTMAEEEWEKMDNAVPFPFPISADTSLKIFLHDEDDIFSQEPTQLLIEGIADRAPVIDTKRTGVGTIVTRNASLPIEGRISDDYGLADAWFGYRIGSDTTLNQTPLLNRPDGQKDFVLNDSSSGEFERFALRPLKLQEGQTLTLGVYAEDKDHLNGPNVAHGELFSFKIVSDDELLARLFDREVNLRLRFEQIRSEVGELRNSLGNETERAQRFDNEPAVRSAESPVLSSFIERSLHQLRKNHTESRAIEVAFRELREEMVNNGIDTKEKLDRIDSGVIAPLKVLNEQLFNTADERYALQRIRLQQVTGVEESINETIPAVDELLAQMDRILDEMRDRGTINDLIQNLQRTIEQQRKLLEETENKRIEENFFFDFDE
ncbi:hypothetical protein AB1L42_20405 [Thalassoglobus sp. JC818]|uniref:hypothetical protein n=1 Tax=Thalassoglobus sp. JC818 TaxID=3232136 RepID=UPI0034579A50